MPGVQLQEALLPQDRLTDPQGALRAVPFDPSSIPKDKKPPNRDHQTTCARQSDGSVQAATDRSVREVDLKSDRLLAPVNRILGLGGRGDWDCPSIGAFFRGDFLDWLPTPLVGTFNGVILIWWGNARQRTGKESTLRTLVCLSLILLSFAALAILT